MKNTAQHHALDHPNSLDPRTEKLKTFFNPTRAKALKTAALVVELLSIVLTISWAYNAREGGNLLFSLVFCAAFIGFVVFKGQSVPLAVTAWRQGNRKLSILSFFLAITSLLMLLFTSVFDVINANGDAVAQRIEASKPAQALDESITMARERLASLAPFADAAKASRNEQETKQHNILIKQQIAEVQAQLNSLEYPPVPSPHNQYMNEDCSPKTNANGIPFTSRAAKGCQVYRALLDKVDQQRHQHLSKLNSLQSQNNTVASYAENHAAYLGTQSHLKSLLEERAQLAENGQGVKSAWRSEDLILAELLGVDPTKANALKWFLFAALFDLLSLIARIIAALVAPASNREEEQKKKLNILLANGFSVDAAMLAIGNNTAETTHPLDSLQVAKVSRPHLDPVPALSTGGRINSDGLAELHSGEIVLNKQAVDFLDKEYNGLCEALNGLSTNQSTDVIKAAVKGKLQQEKHPAATANTCANPSTQKVATAPIIKAEKEINHVSAGHQTPPNSSPQPMVINRIKMDGVRVPRKYSQRSARSRQGKIDVCKHCGNDYVVSVFNRVFCSPECKEAQHAYVPKKATHLDIGKIPVEMREQLIQNGILNPDGTSRT